MEKSFDPKSEFQFKSYQEYVFHLAQIQQEYAWLSEFLSSHSTQFSEPSILIVDSIKSQLQCTPQNPITAPVLNECLDQRPPDVATRLILVTYQQTWSINRTVIEVLGNRFSIDPVFFWQTFDHYYAKNDDLCPLKLRERGTQGTLWTFPLPSEQHSLDIAYVDAGLNCLFLGGSDDTGEARTNTVVIFLRDPMSCIAGFTSQARPTLQQLSHALQTGQSASFAQDTLASRYKAELLRFTNSQVESADLNPVEYAYPYIKLMAVEVFARLQRQSFFLENEYLEGNSLRAKTEALEEGWALVHDTRLYMTNSRASVERFCNSESPAAQDLRADYNALMQQIKLVQDDLRDYMSRHVGMLTLKDSGKAIEQTDSVNRLTKLAFIFIPLSFVTSVFGMNIVELGTGQVNIWVVVVVMVGLSVLVMATVIFALWRSRRARRAVMAEPRGPFATFVRLSLISFKDSLWLLLFFLTHGENDREKFCGVINEPKETGHRDRNNYPCRPLAAGIRFPQLKRGGKSALWKNRAERMNMLLTTNVESV